MTTALPSLSTLHSEMSVVSIPLTTAFRGLKHREVAIFRSPTGSGEWAAFSEYNDEEAAWWLRAALEQRSDSTFPLAAGQELWVPVNAIVPALPTSDVAPWLDQFAGCPAVKVKVADRPDSLDDDLERVKMVRRVVGDDVLIRIDVNGGWDVDDAYRAISALSEFGIDYVEQPVATLEQMRELKSRLGSTLRLAADELVRTTRRVDHLGLDACDVVIIKPSPLGGSSRAEQLAKEALVAGFDVTVSSALETSLGLSHAAALGAQINAFTGNPTAHGLGTAPLLSGDVSFTRLIPENGHVRVRHFEVSDELLDEFAAPEERTQWWHKRLDRCYPLLSDLS